MAIAEAQPIGSRPLLANVRVSSEERRRLKQVAADRGITVSDLIRQALARDGCLPALN